MTIPHLSRGLRLPYPVELLQLFVSLVNKFYQWLSVIELFQISAFSASCASIYIILFQCWEGICGLKLYRSSCTPENKHLHICSLDMLYSDYGTKELYLSLLLLSVWQDSPLCCSALSGGGSVESHEVVVSTQQQDICSPGNIMELGHSTNSFPKTTQYAPTALVQLSHRMFGASKNGQGKHIHSTETDPFYWFMT